nr:DUF3179 domain-containing protein [Candidatus Berkelbacteria bacterium]
VNGKAKAYTTEAIKKQPFEDTFEGKTIVGDYDKQHDIVRLYEKNKDGSLKRINPVGAFWFSWVAAHPDTQLYN